MLVSFASWLGLQTVIMVGANFRTFPVATRSIIVATPSLAAIGVCCALKEIQGGHFAPISLGQLEIFPADIEVFTTSTLVIFMAKKAYLKWTRMHPAFSGWHCIPCIRLCATLKYAVVYQVPRRTATAIAASIEQIQLQ